MPKFDPVCVETNSCEFQKFLPIYFPIISPMQWSQFILTSLALMQTFVNVKIEVIRVLLPPPPLEMYSVISAHKHGRIHATNTKKDVAIYVEIPLLHRYYKTNINMWNEPVLLGVFDRRSSWYVMQHLKRGDLAKAIWLFHHHDNCQC